MSVDVANILNVDLDKVLKLIPGYDPFAQAKDYHLDEERAIGAINFFAMGLKHVKGPEAGKPFFLEPWQQGVIASTFGFVDDLGRRRYQTVFLYVPRKNGKTALGAGIVIYVLFCDGEPGAEIYSAAADREQASLVFAHVKGMIEQETNLRDNCEIHKSIRAVFIDGLNSSYKVLTSEAATKHGYNPSLVVFDEIHAQPNADLHDALSTGQGARTQPLFVEMTTADFTRPSLCNNELAYARAVRDNGGDPSKPGFDPRHLPVIFETLPDADWTDEATWRKVNPNLDVSVSMDFLRRQFRKAKEQPSFENTFKRLYLNLQTEQAERWLQIDAWDKCAGEPKPLDGRVCYGGLDLGSTRDLTALVLAFPDDDGADRTYDIKAWFWCPEDSARERELRDKVPYLTWERQGHIELTPGNVTDYRYVRRRVNEIASTYRLGDIGYDLYNARHLAASELAEEDGIPMVEFRQGYLSMNEPCKEIERLVLSGRIRHGGNPVLRWMAGNVAIATDPAGNIKLDKKRSYERIDGMVALAMAFGRSMSEDTSAVDAYRDEGLTII